MLEIYQQAITLKLVNRVQALVFNFVSHLTANFAVLHFLLVFLAHAIHSNISISQS